ncbi:3974_t:CDS:2 [Diversispora eburnea]|uniref:3974_t:CDS:1 n=1 Tax=Diversispora eburnea TaxID=1213867 RepID=A0A9N8Z4I5_9GLOM|nr:3974_t:CDS:2 [Diversispora eburnea]
MLSLIPDPPVPELIEFCQNENIRNIHLQVAKFKDNVPLSYSKAIQSVQVDGANVTGLVVACLRKLQMWSIPSVMGEFLRYLRGGVISFEESEFIEKFSAEIEIPYTIPSWLWEGKVTFDKHPTLKLKFKDPGMIEQFEQKKQKKKSIEEDVNRKRVGGDLLESFTKVQTKYGENVIEDEETEVSMTLQALALEVFYQKFLLHIR